MKLIFENKEEKEEFFRKVYSDYCPEDFLMKLSDNPYCHIKNKNTKMRVSCKECWRKILDINSDIKKEDHTDILSNKLGLDEDKNNRFNQVKDIFEIRLRNMKEERKILLTKRTRAFTKLSEYNRKNVLRAVDPEYLRVQADFYEVDNVLKDLDRDIKYIQWFIDICDGEEVTSV